MHTNFRRRGNFDRRVKSLASDVARVGTRLQICDIQCASGLRIKEPKVRNRSSKLRVSVGCDLDVSLCVVGTCNRLEVLLAVCVVRMVLFLRLGDGSDLAFKRRRLLAKLTLKGSFSNGTSTGLTPGPVGFTPSGDAITTRQGWGPACTYIGTWHCHRGRGERTSNRMTDNAEAARRKSELAMRALKFFDRIMRKRASNKGINFEKLMCIFEKYFELQSGL